MSSKPETTYYRNIHKLLPKELHCEKMNNPYRGGTADVWYSGMADDLWVEYKYIAKPPKRAPIVIASELSPLQLEWLRGRYIEGRNVCVILGTPLNGFIYEAREWETKNLFIDELMANGLSKQAVADYIRRRTMIT